jgi:hypothetical protein
MSNDDLPIRKKLSLKVKRDKPDNFSHNTKPSDSPIIQNNTELLALQNEKDKLLEKIEQIEKRLVFGYSEPLQAQCTELKKQDILLSCKMTDILDKTL